MREDPLQQWMQEAQKAEETASTSADTRAEETGTAEVRTAMGAEKETETVTMKTEPLDLYHWQKVVVMVQADFQ